MLLASPSYFAEHGYSSDVLSTGDTPGPTASAFGSAGFGVHHIRFARTPLFFLRVYRLMHRYDVIHLHTERANFWFGLVALASRPRRLLRTFTASSHSRRITPATRVSTARSASTRRYTRRARSCRPAQRGAALPPPNAARAELVRQQTVLPSHRARAAPLEGVFRVREQRDRSRDHRYTVHRSRTTADFSKRLARLPRKDRPVYLHVGIEEHGQPERELAEEAGCRRQCSLSRPRTRPPPRLRRVGPVRHAVALRGGPASPYSKRWPRDFRPCSTDVGGLRDLRTFYPGLSYAEPDCRARWRRYSPDCLRSRPTSVALAVPDTQR